MRRVAGGRRPEGRAPRRAKEAAIEQSGPGAVTPPITEHRRQAKIRSRAAAQKLAAERAQVKWLSVLGVYDMDKYIPCRNDRRDGGVNSLSCMTVVVWS